MRAARFFADWQADYAAHDIATFPVGSDKKPLVSRYNRFGLRASSAIARRYPDAPAIGFMAGRRNRITIGDVDEVGEKPLQRFLDHHGNTPVIARTASGKHHAWYRHNGERRVIRPEPEVKVDILGGGLVVAPPSRGVAGQYQFITGGLDDLDKLPVMRNLPGIDAVADGYEFGPELAEMRDGNGRNAALFRLVGRAAHHADDIDQLLDYARTQNECCAEPMTDAEVTKIVSNVWKMQCEGRNRFGQFGAYVPLAVVNELALANPDALALLNVLKANNGPNSIFPIANAMAETVISLGWRRFAQARKAIIGLGLVKQVSAQTQRKPAMYRWSHQIQCYQSGE